MRLHRVFSALAALSALAACEENAVQDITGPAPTARIRFFNVGINAPAVHLYSADQKVTASVSTSCQGAANPPATAADTACHTAGVESTAGIAYAGVAAGGNYVGIAPGQHTLAARLMAGTAKGTAISSVSTTIADDSHYSYFVTGFYNATSMAADAFVVQDNILPEFDWSGAWVRFVNASPNSQPMTLHLTDIATGATMNVGGAVAYKSAGAYVKVPIGGYNLATRYDGSATNRIVQANIGFEAGGVYSVVAFGDMTVTSATAATRPQLGIAVDK